MSRTLEDCWESYLNKVVPKDASNVQLSETRQAFYAGALSVWSMLMSEDMDEATCDSVQQSLDSFGIDFIENLIHRKTNENSNNKSPTFQARNLRKRERTRRRVPKR